MLDVTASFEEIGANTAKRIYRQKSRPSLVGLEAGYCLLVTALIKPMRN